MASLKVMCARSMHVVVGALTDAFVRETGHDVQPHFATVGAIAQRLDSGESADVLVIGAPALAAMAREARVGAATPVAITSIGVAVREGAPAPDIATPDALKQALIAARAIAFSDPAVGGSAGVYLARLFADLGLAGEIARKGMPQQTGAEVARRVAGGEADIGMTLMAEIAPIAGARIIGPLPPPLGNDTIYAAAVTSASSAKDAGRDFIVALTRPATRGAWQGAGFRLP